jgi:hypothetical protein
VRFEKLDRMLADEDDVVPSSGFVSSVMDAVTRDATAPPLPFPWRRAWPLAVVSCALFVWIAVLLLRSSVAITEPDPFAWFKAIAPMSTEWVAAALLTTAAVTAWSLRRVASLRR